MKTRDVERFETKYIPEPNSGCWLWIDALSPDGYARFWWGNRNGSGHRFSYHHHRSPVPDGLVIDHLCRNRCCVNPSHLEAVSQYENIIRGDTVARRALLTGKCHRGHPLDGVDTEGYRKCLECARVRARLFYHRKKNDSSSALAERIAKRLGVDVQAVRR